MKFPEWIDDPKQTDQERASKRLRYLLRRVALDIDGEGQLMTICRAAQIDHSSLACAIKRGYLTQAMATMIEYAIGKSVIPHEWLMKPLEIPTE